MDFEAVIKWWERAKFDNISARDAIELNKATICLGRMIEQCRKDSTQTESMLSKAQVQAEPALSESQQQKSKSGRQGSKTDKN